MLSVVTVDTHRDVVDPSDQVTSLREAIEITNDLEGDDEIVFDLGHDEPVTIQLEHGELALTDAVTIAGPGRELLTIDAQHQSRIFNITAKEHDFVIEGLTLTAGRGREQGAPLVGGAIRSDTSGLLTLRNSVITNSEVADWVGGAAIAAAGDVAIESSIISANTGATWWGSVLARGQVTVSFSAITENSSGGIRADGDVTIASSTMSGNGDHVYSDIPRPGIIWSYNGDVTVNSSTISQNLVTGVRAGGNVTVDSSTISRNRGGSQTLTFAVRAAGGITADGDIAITASTISENTNGGVKAGGNVAIKSSTIVGNLGNQRDRGVQGDRGAGVAFFGDLILENSIVAANQVGDFEFAPLGAELQEAIHEMCVLRRDCPTEPTEWNVSHSLIGHNRDTPLVEAPLGHPDSNGNFIGGPVGGAIAPRLGPLRDNGGPTLTHALLPDSPAINMGDSSAVIGVGGLPRFDQRGEPYSRIAGGRIDMGAVESRPIGDSNGDGLFDSSDLIKVFQAGKYEDDIANNANFDEGDWNGDGDFDTGDLVLAFQAGNYITAATPIAAVVDQLFDNDRDQLRADPADPLAVFE